MKRISIFLILMLIVMVQHVHAEDDFQYWSGFSTKVVDTEHIDLTTLVQLRLKEDASKLGLYFISEKLTFDYFEHLGLGINYTYLETRATASTSTDKDYKTHHRLELEANPHWMLWDWLNLSVRNRVEYRWIEEHGSFNTRFRQNWKLSKSLDIKWLNSVYASSEVFYDFANHQLNEYRNIPIGVTFPVNKKVSMNVYYMVQSLLGAEDWSSKQILGTNVTFKF